MYMTISACWAKNLQNITFHQYKEKSSQLTQLLLAWVPTQLILQMLLVSNANSISFSCLCVGYDVIFIFVNYLPGNSINQFIPGITTHQTQDMTNVATHSRYNESRFIGGSNHIENFKSCALTKILPFEESMRKKKL